MGRNLNNKEDKIMINNYNDDFEVFEIEVYDQGEDKETYSI